MSSTFRFILFAFLIHHSFFASAQNLWINAMPFYYNPSFAGNSSQARIAVSNSIIRTETKDLNSSDAKEKIGQNFISFDKFIGKIHSGVGAQFRYSNDVGYLNNSVNMKSITFEGSIVIAPKFSFKGKYTLSPSLQFTHSNLSYHYQGPNSDSLAASNSTGTIGLTQLNSGILFNSKKFFAGISVVLLNRISKNVEYPSFSGSFITGYTFRRTEKSNFSLTPVVFFQVYRDNNYSITSSYNNPIYFIFDDNSYSSLSLSAKYRKVIAGIGINRTTNIMLGYEGNKLRIMLIGQYVRSTIKSVSYLNESYAAQLSFRYLFGPSTVN
jgi:hypothetical protein